MAVHKYTSWGRTRRPKAASAAGDKHYITGTSGIGALTGLGGVPDEANGIYKTENQRYMHLMCSGSNSGISEVYGFLYASNSWAEIMTGSAGQSYGSISVGTDEYKVVEIYGVDLVAFVTSSSTKLPYANFAAFSTF